MLLDHEHTLHFGKAHGSIGGIHFLPRPIPDLQFCSHEYAKPTAIRYERSYLFLHADDIAGGSESPRVIPIDFSESNM